MFVFETELFNLAYPKSRLKISISVRTRHTPDFQLSFELTPSSPMLAFFLYFLKMKERIIIHLSVIPVIWIMPLMLFIRKKKRKIKERNKQRSVFPPYG